MSRKGKERLKCISSSKIKFFKKINCITIKEQEILLLVEIINNAEIEMFFKKIPLIPIETPIL